MSSLQSELICNRAGSGCTLDFSSTFWKKLTIYLTSPSNCSTMLDTVTLSHSTCLTNNQLTTATFCATSFCNTVVRHFIVWSGTFTYTNPRMPPVFNFDSLLAYWPMNEGKEWYFYDMSYTQVVYPILLNHGE